MRFRPQETCDQKSVNDMDKRRKLNIGILITAIALMLVAIPAVVFGVIVDYGIMTSSKMIVGLWMVLFGQISGFAYGPLATPYYMIMFAVMENM